MRNGDINRICVKMKIYAWNGDRYAWNEDRYAQELGKTVPSCQNELICTGKWRFSPESLKIEHYQAINTRKQADMGEQFILTIIIAFSKFPSRR